MSLVSGGMSSRTLREAIRSIRKPALGFVNNYQILKIDMNSPPGTTNRAEITSSLGNIQPKILTVTLDDELHAEIHVIAGGQEVALTPELRPPATIIDVEGVYGVVETPKLIFIIKAPYGTTKPNWGVLLYFGRVVPPG